MGRPRVGLGCHRLLEMPAIWEYFIDTGSLSPLPLPTMTTFGMANTILQNARVLKSDIYWFYNSFLLALYSFIYNKQFFFSTLEQF